MLRGYLDVAEVEIGCGSWRSEFEVRPSVFLLKI